MTRLEVLLKIIPGKIEHSIVKHIWNEEKGRFDYIWSDDKTEYKLRIEKIDNKFEASYVFTGFEGEIQRLPISERELSEVQQYGCVLEYEDLSKITLEETLENLVNWCKEHGYL